MIWIKGINPAIWHIFKIETQKSVCGRIKPKTNSNITDIEPFQFKCKSCMERVR